MTPEITDAVLDWYDRSARELPWRAAGVSPWAVLVSEVMLQQTPVARVVPAFEAWMDRWPTPVRLAAATPGDAVRMWGKLGYPRRALRLHACSREIVERFDAEVPADVAALLTLPGVGTYTARAVAAFAFGQRQPVLDTNVRRVVARAVDGAGEAGPPSMTRELEAMQAMLPSRPDVAARFSAALMELGAMLCTARTPRCASCPIAHACAWRLAGAPAYTGPTAAPQRFAGTDRQVRGLLLDVLRGSDRPVPQAELDLVWPDGMQRERALDALVADGLVEPLPHAHYALPS